MLNITHSDSTLDEDEDIDINDLIELYTHCSISAYPDSEDSDYDLDVYMTCTGTVITSLTEKVRPDAVAESMCLTCQSDILPTFNHILSIEFPRSYQFHQEANPMSQLLQACGRQRKMLKYARRSDLLLLVDGLRTFISFQILLVGSSSIGVSIS